MAVQGGENFSVLVLGNGKPQFRVPEADRTSSHLEALFIVGPVKVGNNAGGHFFMMNQGQHLAVRIHLYEAGTNLEFFQNGGEGLKIDVGPDHGHILILKIEDVRQDRIRSGVQLAPVGNDGLLAENEPVFVFHRDGHARKQIDGALFQTPDALAVGTGKIAYQPAFFVCDVVEKIDGNALHLTVGVGEDQRGGLMKTHDDWTVGDGCRGSPVQPEKNEQKDRVDSVFHEAIWGCMIQPVQLLWEIR